MRRHRRRRWGAHLALSLACLAAIPAHGQVEDAYGDDYGPGNYGRIRFAEDGVSIIRAETEAIRDPAAAGLVNAPIFPGDTVVTEPGQRVEIQLASGSVVRVDGSSQVGFLALADPYGDPPDNTVLQLAEGCIRLEAAVTGSEEAFRIDTPASAIYLLEDADLRVEVRDGQTLVSSRLGVAEIVAGGVSLILRAGLATETEPGRPPDDPRAFNTFVADDFDRWVAERETRYATVDGSAGDDSRSFQEMDPRPHTQPATVRREAAPASSTSLHSLGATTGTNGAARMVRPTVTRPLVQPEQDKEQGTSERLKDIYRKMSQPLPTRSQAVSGSGSEAEDGDKSGDSPRDSEGDEEKGPSS